MIIRNVEVKDIPQVVSIHLNAFNGFFLSTLGAPFLKFYYTAFSKSVESIFLCLEEDGKILGFSAMTQNSKGFNARLIRNNFWGFCIIAFKLLFSNPKGLLRLAKNLTKKSDSVVDDEDYAELYSIGVKGEVQGKGLGKLLLNETEKLAFNAGVKKLSLTTDYYDNDSTVAFYKKMGYENLYDFVTYPNRRMFRLIKSL